MFVFLSLWFPRIDSTVLPPHACETVHDADTTGKLGGNELIQSSEHGWKAEQYQILHIEELDDSQSKTTCDKNESR